jgi:hypothetical protein
VVIHENFRLFFCHAADFNEKVSGIYQELEDFLFCGSQNNTIFSLKGHFFIVNQFLIQNFHIFLVSGGI